MFVSETKIDASYPNAIPTLSSKFRATPSTEMIGKRAAVELWP